MSCICFSVKADYLKNHWSEEAVKQAHHETVPLMHCFISLDTDHKWMETRDDSTSLKWKQDNAIKVVMPSMPDELKLRYKVSDAL